MKMTMGAFRFPIQTFRLRIENVWFPIGPFLLSVLKFPAACSVAVQDDYLWFQDDYLWLLTTIFVINLVSY